MLIERYAKLDNGKWCYVGHDTQDGINELEHLCINTKIKHYKGNDKIYKTYKYVSGKIETVRFDIYL